MKIIDKAKIQNVVNRTVTFNSLGLIYLVLHSKNHFKLHDMMIRSSLALSHRRVIFTVVLPWTNLMALIESQYQCQGRIEVFPLLHC